MIQVETESITDVDRLILDTARGVFETYGVRRANIEDVAARAGVSRSTIYRRFPTKDDLFEKVVRREAEVFFSTLDRATTGRTPQEAVIEAFALGVRLVHDSPLYSRIVESEPELFGLFSRSQVFPIGQFADGIAHTLRRCGADIPEADLATDGDDPAGNDGGLGAGRRHCAAVADQDDRLIPEPGVPGEGGGLQATDGDQRRGVSKQRARQPPLSGPQGVPQP
jgi:TetR/AcrR family transcriptional regulator